MNKSKDLTPSMEDYLEAVAFLKKEKRVARVRDISRRLRVKTPSVSGALAALVQRRLVVHERYGYVELTAQGGRIARRVQGRHDMLVKFLTGILNIDRNIAEDDACRMEHAISPQTVERLTKFLHTMEKREKQ